MLLPGRYSCPDLGQAAPRQRFSVNSALQYGHLAQPVDSTGRYTRGWLFHSDIEGIGQDRGRSATVTW